MSRATLYRYLEGLNESPSKKEGKSIGDDRQTQAVVVRLNESPSKKEGKSHPKLARNHAAETGTPREPRGRPHKKYTQTSLHAPKHP